MDNKVKKLLKTLLKFALSGLALWFVFSKISWVEVSSLLIQTKVVYLLLAGILFISSKVLSAYRLQLFFKAIDVDMPHQTNLKLYWVGMFYNLFLPGGVGGDGYKVYLLHRKYGTPVKLLIQASLIDRVSGLVSLLFLAGIGFLWLDLTSFPTWVWSADVCCLLAIFPSFYLLSKYLFGSFISALAKAMAWSLGVQLLQVVSAFMILYALGVQDNLMGYAVLFLVSSFVSIFPFTIGGLGSREFTFLMGYQYFGIDESVSIALSLLFTLISAFVSFGGIFIKAEKL